MFDELFPFAVEAGIDAREYWLYTLAEIQITLKGYKMRLATTAAMNYKQADLISAAVGRLFNKGVKFPPAHEAYPGLIEAPAARSQLDWRIAKQRLMKYAQAHNAKRREVKHE